MSKRSSRRSVSTPLFDALDRDQRDAHGPRLHLVLPAESEPPVTPPPSPEERRDTGIQRAADHANRVRKEWTASTVVYATNLIKRCGYKPFLIEEIREIAERDGIAVPADSRAWGHVAVALARNGIIRKMGYQSAKSSNCSPKVLWSRAVAEKEEASPARLTLDDISKQE